MHDVNIHSGEYDVAVAVHAAEVVKKVATMKQGVTLQKAKETKGAMEQWRRDVSCAVDAFTVADSPHPMHGGELTREPLDSCDVQQAREHDTERFKHVGVFETVPVQQAR